MNNQTETKYYLQPYSNTARDKNFNPIPLENTDDVTIQECIKKFLDEHAIEDRRRTLAIQRSDTYEMAFEGYNAVEVTKVDELLADEDHLYDDDGKHDTNVYKEEPKRFLVDVAVTHTFLRQFRFKVVCKEDANIRVE